MAKMLFSFPGGAAGWALLFLRFSVALLPIAVSLYFGPFALWWRFSAYVLAALTIAGLFTRPAAAICALGTLGLSWTRSDALSTMLLLHVLDMLALIALGAGAYSTDAWIYGRRVVRF